MLTVGENEESLDLGRILLSEVDVRVWEPICNADSRANLTARQRGEKRYRFDEQWGTIKGRER